MPVTVIDSREDAHKYERAQHARVVDGHLHVTANPAREARVYAIFAPNRWLRVEAEPNGVETSDS